ncbi:hypothetical protein F5972_01625 [Microbispora cellulosiformans]|uniref:Uncharacterized protein n=1 Tax=Microbispora cellulosiformans TaxID=2614688 RepID=A0A5J5KA43_9ACTN|nr:hypothetical protein [Microbispora cellulosiformans]KAA9381562.1 hypothetical protein F5972_01625 [Microbispora cellulosiformans]
MASVTGALSGAAGLAAAPAEVAGYPHAPVWAVLAAALLAILGVVNHVRFVRSGPDSTWAARYFDTDNPKELRNLPFAQLPGAVMLAMWAVMLAYTRVSGQETWDAVMGLFLFASFVFGGVAVKRLYRPPRRAKPQWLLDEEERQARRGA